MPGGSKYKVDQLPVRYQVSPRSRFDERIAASLAPGGLVLDVGGGRNPCVSSAQRPVGCIYAGLDISSAELAAAPPGSYDEMWVGRVEEYRPELEGRFDLVVSWQVLEHVRNMAESLANIRRYLRPGGTFIAQLSGRFSVFAALNALIPQRPAIWVMERLLDRPPDSVFPAYYNRCWQSALLRLGGSWASFEVVPIHCSAIYFNFSKRLQRAYLAYEDWIAAHELHNLAGHYLIVGVR